MNVDPKDFLEVKPEEYLKLVENFMDVMDLAPKKEVARLVLEVSDYARTQALSEKKSDQIESHLNYALVKGFLSAHTVQDSPSNMVIGGHMMSAMENFIKNLNNIVGEMEDE